MKRAVAFTMRWQGSPLEFLNPLSSRKWACESVILKGKEEWCFAPCLRVVNERGYVQACFGRRFSNIEASQFIDLQQNSESITNKISFFFEHDILESKHLSTNTMSSDFEHVYHFHASPSDGVRFQSILFVLGEFRGVKIAGASKYSLRLTGIMYLHATPGT